MKNGLTTFLFILLALNVSSQVYSLYLTVNGTNKYIKDGTDSVYSHDGNNYIFDRKVSVKRFTPHSMVTNAPATISNVDSNIVQTKYRSDTSRNNTYAALAGKQPTLGFTPVPESRTVNGQALSGNITITTISGNAGSATALQTPRTINEISFDGTANINTNQFISLTSTYTLISQTGLQRIFNSTANGAFTVSASTSYFFECEFSLTAMSATSGNFSFGLGGTATLTSIRYTSIASKTAIATPSTAQIATIAVATSSALVSANTTTTGRAYITGIIRVNAGGTIIPSVGLGIAATAVVGVNSWFKITPIGTNTQTSTSNFN